MREDDGPAITDEVIKLDSSMGAISFKVGNCVSEGQAWHFQCNGNNNVKASSFVFRVSLLDVEVGENGVYKG